MKSDPQLRQDINKLQAENRELRERVKELSSTIPPGPFADDAAAASGGVPVGAMYRQTGGGGGLCYGGSRDDPPRNPAILPALGRAGRPGP